MKTIKNILVTTDFSKDYDIALEEAALLAEKFHASLYILDVVERIYDSSADYVIPYEIVTDQRERLIKNAHEKMLKKAAEMAGRYRIKAFVDVRYGDRYDEIIKEEDEKKIDLVVIAPHKRKAFTGKLFSHLSDKIAKNSCCDTLVIRQHSA